MNRCISEETGLTPFINALMTESIESIKARFNHITIYLTAKNIGKNWWLEAMACGTNIKDLILALYLFESGINFLDRIVVVNPGKLEGNLSFLRALFSTYMRLILNDSFPSKGSVYPEFMKKHFVREIQYFEMMKPSDIPDSDMPFRWIVSLDPELLPVIYRNRIQLGMAGMRIYNAFTKIENHHFNSNITDDDKKLARKIGKLSSISSFAFHNSINKGGQVTGLSKTLKGFFKYLLTPDALNMMIRSKIIPDSIEMIMPTHPGKVSIKELNIEIMTMSFEAPLDAELLKLNKQFKQCAEFNFDILDFKDEKLFLVKPMNRQESIINEFDYENQTADRLNKDMPTPDKDQIIEENSIEYRNLLSKLKAFITSFCITFSRNVINFTRSVPKTLMTARLEFVKNAENFEIQFAKLKVDIHTDKTKLEDSHQKYGEITKEFEEYETTRYRDVNSRRPEGNRNKIAIKDDEEPPP